MPTVITLRNPRALMLPNITAIIDRAFTSVKIVAPGGLNTVAEDLFKMINDPLQFLMIGMEAGEPKSVIMGFLPNTNLFPYPTVTLFYNEGSKELLRASKAYLFDTLSQAGYTKCWAINSTGRSDAAWIRVFSDEHVAMKPIGSVIELSVK